MANLVNLLQVGGFVFHVSPTSGWVNHGFYQLNPCFFFDFYRANGQFDAWLVQLGRRDANQKAQILPYCHTQELLEIDDQHSRFLFIFCAAKQQSSKLCIPTQGYYQADRSAQLLPRPAGHRPFPASPSGLPTPPFPAADP